MRTLNLGCGSRKIPGAVNVDIEKTLSPDIVADFTEKLPFPDADFDEVYLFHTIEHVQKKFHEGIFREVRRVLQEGGIFYLSYPEFSVIAKNWLENKQGNREFWEHTIYGRQLYPNDYHLCAMDTNEVRLKLEMCGFKDIAYRPEPHEYNTILKATACELPDNIEKLIYDEVIMK